MITLAVRTWIANAAAVFSPCWGAVTHQTAQAGCSRQIAYEHARKVEQAVKQFQQHDAPQVPEHDQIAEVLEENRELWELAEHSVVLDQDRLQKFGAAAAALGLSLNQIVDLLNILLPSDQQSSRSAVHRAVQAASQCADQVLKVLDQACQSRTTMLAIDEIFFRSQPVLVAVEPLSMAWLVGQRAADRTGATWAQALQPWDRVEYIAADGGSGLQSGLQQVAQMRREDPTAPSLKTGLDQFHTQREMRTTFSRLEKKVEQKWEEMEQAERRHVKDQRQGRHAARSSAAARKAQRQVEVIFAEYEQAEQALAGLKHAWDLFLADGALNTRPLAESRAAAAAARLSDHRWAKTRRLLQDERAFTFLDRLHDRLEEVEPNPLLREALVRLVWLRRRRHADVPETEAVQIERQYLLQMTICRQLSPDWRHAYRRVAAVFRETLRASSAVECMNSVLRMHQARHRTLNQPLLDLKRLYWNCRPFREGQRAKKCPYELLGLQLPTSDWWALLQMDPKQLAVHLGVSPPPASKAA